jgi:hypothetical protein
LAEKEKTTIKLPVTLIYAYNPSYSGDRDVKNQSSRFLLGGWHDPSYLEGLR